MDLLQEIKRRLEIEERNPAELMESLQSMMMAMYFKRKLTTETVIASCVCLISLHEQLKGAQNG